MEFMYPSMHIKGYAHTALSTVLALLCGIFIAIAFLQQDPWFKGIVEEYVQREISNIIKTQFSCKVEEINFFTGQMLITQATSCAAQEQPQWSFACPKMTLTISLISLVSSGFFQATLEFYQPIIESTVEGATIAITEPLSLLIDSPITLPIFLSSCTIRQARLDLLDKRHDAYARFLFASDTFYKQGAIKTNVLCSDGVLCLREKDYSQYIAGNVAVEVPLLTDKPWTWHAFLSMTVPQLPTATNRCTLLGNYKNGIAAFQLSNADKTLQIQATDITHNQTSVQGDVALESTLQMLTWALANGDSFDKGKLRANGHVMVNEKQDFDYAGLLTMQELQIGTYSFDEIALQCKGTARTMQGELTLTASPGAQLRGSCDWDGQKITTALKGNLLSTLIKQVGLQEVQTEGTLGTETTFTDDGCITKLILQNAHIRLSSMHNSIHDAQGTIEVDFKRGVVNFNDSTIMLSKGLIGTLASTIQLQPSGQLSSAHVPLKFSSCLVSWQKEFFGLVSGLLTGTYAHNSGSTIIGQLIIDKSHLRSNLFSGQVQKDMVNATLSSLMLYKTNSSLDIHVITRSPLKVSTPFLKAKARIDLTLGGTIHQPELSGSIELQEGALLFPYKPLYITSAKMDIVPQELDDPSIDLTAKNKIKKFAITMQVRGTLRNPVISFESSPALEEEQIITLLLAGTEEGSLCLVMPSVIMQGLGKLLFEPSESTFSWQNYLMTILKPLKNIRFTQANQDMNGRSLKGGIEIDVTDRLHASIQNNLTLSEDTQLELEYALSDDISIRGTKDERGIIAGEVEMRWKF